MLSDNDCALNTNPARNRNRNRNANPMRTSLQKKKMMPQRTLSGHLKCPKRFSLTVTETLALTITQTQTPCSVTGQFNPYLAIKHPLILLQACLSTVHTESTEIQA